MPQMAQMGHYGSVPQQQYAYAMGVQGMPGMQGYYTQPQYYYSAGAGARLSPTSQQEDPDGVKTSFVCKMGSLCQCCGVSLQMHNACGEAR